jgi:DnaJ-class molecular chaperone
MNRPASRTVIERDPLLGSTEWTITACQPCDGTGRVWHPGCGDNDTPCNRCDGVGEAATSRPIFNK